MKKLILVLLPIILYIVACSCDSGNKNNKNDRLYYDMTMKIVSIQKYNSESSYPGEWLLQYVHDTTSYCRWLVKSDSIFYNHQVGDIVKFDYILKSRFFTINPR